MVSLNINSKLLRKLHIKFYNISLCFSGLFLVHKKSISMIQSNLKNNDIFVDIGCGTGILIFKLLKIISLKIKIYGIDLDSRMIDIAQNKLQTIKSLKILLNNIHFKIAHSDDLPLVKESIDFVNSSLSFHHMEEKIKINTIKEINRILKTNGYFLISDLGRPKNWWGSIFYFFSKHSFTENNIQIIENECLKYGFRKIKTNINFGYIEHILWQKIS